MVVTQVVRRFGRVGGMESYVWNLCKHLLQFEVTVNLICEEVIEQLPGLAESNIWRADQPPNVRPRWRAMRHFQSCVEHLIRGEPRARWGVIHSHERLCSHDVTTIHGPLMGNYDSFGFWERLNRRVAEWSKMEKLEVSGVNVRAVCCVSEIARKQLVQEYIKAPVCSQIMWPGVDVLNGSTQGGGRDINRIFFVGKEWKRKGLEFAVDVVRSLRDDFPLMHLHVYGPEIHHVPRKLRGEQWVRFHGFAKPPFETCGLLIHPAINEPFGMVISEARAAGVPCLTSTQVGAVGLGFDDVVALNLDDGLDLWRATAHELLAKAKHGPQIVWSWSDLARAYMDVYDSV